MRIEFQFPARTPSDAPVSRVVSVTRCSTDPAPTEAIDDTPFSFAFTGRHDGGALPVTDALTNGRFGHLLAAIEVRARRRKEAPCCLPHSVITVPFTCAWSCQEAKIRALEVTSAAAEAE